LLAQLKIPSLNVPGASGATSGVSSAATVMGTGGAATYASVAVKEASDAVTYFSQVVTDAFQTIDDSVAKNSLINLAASGIISNFNPGSLKGSEGSISTFSGGGAYDRGGTTVNVTVQGSVLSEQDLVQVVQNAVQANNRYGNNLNVAGSL